MNTILAPIDFSDATSSVIEAATTLSRALRAKIVLAHVIRPATVVTEFGPVLEGLASAAEYSAVENLGHWKTELQNDGLDVEASQLYGDPAPCICGEARRISADYIVIGSHGHRALYDLIMGGTASQLLRKAPCPVLIVPIMELIRKAPDIPAARAEKIPT